MACLIWLPLQGTLDNLGIADVSIEGLNLTANNQGILGQCYSWNGSNSYVKITDNTGGAVGGLNDVLKGAASPYTMCCWYCTADTNRIIWFGDFSTENGLGINWELYAKSNSSALRYYWAGAPDRNCGPSTWWMFDNKWHHAAIAYDGTKTYFYKDGIQVGTDTYTYSQKKKTSGYWLLGRDGRTGGTAYSGQFNDFRIYDQCLSEKEIHEIAKGLILHQMLDYKNPNMLSPTARFGPGNNGSTGQLLSNYSCTLVSDTNSVRASNNRISQLGFNGSTGPYTFSCDVKSNATGAIDFDFCDASSYRLNVSTPNEWYHVVYSSTVSNYNTSNNYNGFLDAYIMPTVKGQVFTFKNLKVEEGSHATEMCDKTINPDIFYDSSGYCHDGIRRYTGNGKLEPFTPSPRYKAATRVVNGNVSNNSTDFSCIRIELELNYIPSFTLAWWQRKENSNAGGILMTSNREGSPTAQDGLEYAHTTLHQRDGGMDMRTIDNSGTEVEGKVVPQAGWNNNNQVWEHYVVTWDGSNAKAYKDGVLKSTTAITGYSTVPFKYLYLGHTGAGGVIRKAIISFSDVRWYVTALSAADVKELYEMSMEIDSNNNIIPRILT